MGQAESAALLAATQKLIDETRVDQKFTVDDTRHIHRAWLGDIYEWAGEYRSVNVSKDGFMFAAAGLIPNLMEGLERGALCTPARYAHGAAGRLACAGFRWHSRLGEATLHWRHPRGA